MQKTKVSLFSKVGVLVAAVVALFASSCSTDFDVNAPWEEITVTYGLLNQSETVHFVKINKTFLGDGNAYTYAQIQDSSEYANVEARVEEWLNDNKTREFTLLDTLIQNKDENGVFYGPEQKMYYFNATLNEDAEYRLIANINEGQKEVTGQTDIVNDFSVGFPIANIPGAPAQVEISLAGINSSQNGVYPSLVLRWESGENAKRYEAGIRFNYIEYTANDTTHKELLWNLGSQKTSGIDGGEGFEREVFGEDFYKFIRDNISNNPDVIMRRVRGLDFLFTVASEDLNTYMEVNEPATGVVQEKPEFTNIGNGIGLFSSRYTKVVDNKWLDRNSLRELANGQHTASLLFCTDTIIHQAENFYCP